MHSFNLLDPSRWFWFFFLCLTFVWWCGQAWSLWETQDGCTSTILLISQRKLPRHISDWEHAQARVSFLIPVLIQVAHVHATIYLLVLMRLAISSPVMHQTWVATALYFVKGYSLSHSLFYAITCKCIGIQGTLGLVNRISSQPHPSASICPFLPPPSLPPPPSHSPLTAVRHCFSRGWFALCSTLPITFASDCSFEQPMLGSGMTEATRHFDRRRLVFCCDLDE